MLFTIPNRLKIFYCANTISRTYPKYFHTFQTPSAHSGNHLLKQHSFLQLESCFSWGGLSGRTTDISQTISSNCWCAIIAVNTTILLNRKILFGTPRRNKFPRHPCNIRDHSGKYYISVTVIDQRMIKVALTVARHSHALWKCWVIIYIMAELLILI